MHLHISSVQQLTIHTSAAQNMMLGAHGGIDLFPTAPLSPAPRIKLDESGDELPWLATSFAALQDNEAGLIIDLRCLHRGNAESCERYAAESTFLGRKWKLAPVEFLFMRVADRTRQDPAVDPDIYPMLRGEWIWSSTPDAKPENPSAPDYAWGVHLGYGNASLYYRSLDGLALPVSELVLPPGQ